MVNINVLSIALKIVLVYKYMLILKIPSFIFSVLSESLLQTPKIFEVILF